MRSSLALAVALAQLLPLVAGQGAVIGPATTSTTAAAAQTTPTTTPAGNTAAAAPKPAATAASSVQQPAANPNSLANVTPTFNFLKPSATYTACEKGVLQWTVVGTNVKPTDFHVNIWADNIGVIQNEQLPPAATSTTPPAQATPTSQVQTPTTSSVANSGAAGAKPASTGMVARGGSDSPPEQMWVNWVNLASRASLNVSVATNWTAAVEATWYPPLPAGRYRFFAAGVDANMVGRSETFDVVEGSNTSCIAEESDKPSAVPGKTSSTVPQASSSSNTTVAGGNATKDAATSETKSKSISGGAIAGIVIGVLAALAIAAILFFMWRRRKASGAGARTIGAPSNFRKGGMDGTHRSSRLGTALSAIGLGGAAGRNASAGSGRSGESDATHGTGYTDSYDLEKAQPVNEKTHAPSHPVALAPMNTRTMSRQSARSAESENPFETAPSTPVEEADNNLGSLAAGAAAVAAAGAVAPAYADDEPTRLPYAYGEPTRLPYANGEPTRLPYADPSFPPPHAPTSLPLTPSERDSAVVYGPNGDADYSMSSGNVAVSNTVRVPSRNSGPQTMPSLPTTPGTPIAPYTDERYKQPPTAFVPAHVSPKSSGSAESLTRGAATPVVQPPSPGSPGSAGTTQPPSSYAPGPSPVSPRVPERKNSLRRKPVPKLLGDSFDGSESRTSSDQLRGKPEQSTTSPSDQFGLNAALSGAGLDRGLSFKLMPDPPLHQED